MVVIPITGSLLGFFLLPFLPGIFWKFVAAIFFGYLVLVGVLVWFVPSLRGEGRKKKASEW